MLIGRSPEVVLEPRELGRRNRCSFTLTLLGARIAESTRHQMMHILLASPCLVLSHLRVSERYAFRESEGMLAVALQKGV